MRRDVFQAIADPTRRDILHLLSGSTMNLNSLADNFDISRPAVSKHIKILIECGLVVIEQNGRERYCTAQLGQLEEVNSWISQYKKFWNKKLDAMGAYLDKLETASSKKSNPGNRTGRRRSSKKNLRKRK